LAQEKARLLPGFSSSELTAISHTDRFGEERWVLAAVESD
jgi:hypothetical protein